MATARIPWKQTLAELGPVFSARAASYDDSDSFVAENYAAMRDARLFSALVPEEMGGGGLSHSEVCGLIRSLGRCCGSTALTLSMHQHLVAAALWNFRHGRPGEKLLRAVADGEKILVSTGATDWLASNGTLEPCGGGYLFTASKVFASGCLAGDLLITSGQYNDPSAGRQVLHFPVSMAAEGVRIDRVWETMGMRGTGSHTVVLENVFVPEQSIALRRPCGEYHPVWNVILTVALPLICAAYVGVAEAAAEKARASAARKGDDGANVFVIGEMENDLTTAQIALESIPTITSWPWMPQWTVSTPPGLLCQYSCRSTPLPVHSMYSMYHNVLYDTYYIPCNSAWVNVSLSTLSGIALSTLFGIANQLR